jgi:hypothetical protein
MAYLRQLKRGKATYLYILESMKRGGVTYKLIKEYLGREDEIEPSELRRALTYWRVKPKGAKRKAKRGRRAV